MPTKTDLISVTINGLQVEIEPGKTVLDAARQVSVHIPTLCKHPDLDATAACGICIVRISGSKKMLRACCTPVEPGMDVTTEDPEIIQVRRTVIEMILSKHPNECLTCGRNQNCELQTIAADFGLRDVTLDSIVPDLPLDDTTHAVTLDPRKCITCGRCIQVCQQIQDVWALSFLQRGIDTRIAPAGDITLADSPCVRCGQCSAHCPTGAIVEYDNTQEVWDKLLDPDAYCVAQLAPAVRVAIGEAFGFPVGTNLTGQTYAALRRMGFNAVFDTNFGADLTIMEEAHEFVKRFTTPGATLPLITTCCPSWVDFMEKFHSDMIPNFSSCKSPQAMVGALAKTYYAEKMGLDPAKVYVVSIMPCTAKKFEIIRSKEMASSGYQDVDVSLTTRELARMIKQSGIHFRGIPEEQPDHILGAYTGAATIFGATGGVMEAALRTAYNLITGSNPARVEFQATRGLDGVKEGKVTIAGHEVRFAVAHGLGNVETVLERVRAARDAGTEPPYHFIEVMACPGGCVGGGGQPYGVTDNLREKRAAGLYQEDQGGLWRCSHDNPYIQELYRDFLGEPLGHKSEQLLHTSYTPRPTYRR
ncbi:MAG TPA: NADH-dependent [FeFe] hydrogenase, group A6 [Candidatus Limnocylindrales bacterium]